MPGHRKESQQGRLVYVFSNGREKIRLEEEAISEILVADTDSESGAAVSNVDLFEEEEEEEQEQEEKEEEEQQQQQASEEVEPQASISGRLPTWRPPQGRTQIFILLSVYQKV